MIRPDQIPEAVLREFDAQLYDVRGMDLEGEHKWQREVFAAALNAWPGGGMKPSTMWMIGEYPAYFYLPLPQDKSDS